MSNQFFEKPILNSPYEYPARHWELDDTGQPTEKMVEARRQADLVTPIPKAIGTTRFVSSACGASGHLVADLLVDVNRMVDLGLVQREVASLMLTRRLCDVIAQNGVRFRTHFPQRRKRSPRAMRL